MPKLDLSGSEQLILTDIRGVRQTYYVVSEDKLKSIVGTSMLADLFFLLSSLLWAAFFSVVIAIKVSVNVPQETVQALYTYKNMFLGFASFVTLLAIVTLIVTYVGIAGIRKSSLPSSLASEPEEAEDKSSRESWRSIAAELFKNI